MTDRNELLNKMDQMIEILGIETVLNEIAQGVTSDELKFQLDAIVRYYDLEENI